MAVREEKRQRLVDLCGRKSWKEGRRGREKRTEAMIYAVEQRIGLDEERERERTERQWDRERDRTAKRLAGVEQQMRLNEGERERDN